MLRRSAFILVCLALAGYAPWTPGSQLPAAAAAQTQYIRVATLLPRDSEIARRFLRVNRDLLSATDGRWGVHLYAGGVAGDEPDILRKMKIGQIDASIITTTGLSHIVHEVAVLDAPGVVPDYKAFDAVTEAMQPEWEKSFEKSGFELLAWSDAGQYRWFSTRAITKPSDLRDHRPWLWPASFVMDEIYRVIGCSGVPLAVPEVYGALQTNMIDSVIATAVTAVELQWHTHLSHVTKATFGILNNGLVMNLKKWQVLPADVAADLRSAVTSIVHDERGKMRQADDQAYAALLKHGYKEDSWARGGRDEYARVEQEVRDQLVGRLYTKSLLERVMGLSHSAK